MKSNRALHLISTHATEDEIKILNKVMEERGFTSRAEFFRAALNAYIGEQIFRPRDLSLRDEMMKKGRWVEKGTEPFNEWRFNGGKVVLNTDKQRIQIFFDNAPDKDTLIQIKLHHYVWVSSAKVWQRPLTRKGVEDTRRIKCLKPIEE